MPDLDSTRVADAMDFYAQLEEAESRLDLSWIRHPTTGIKPTTRSTLTITATGIELLDLYAGTSTAGDGTVPAVSLARGLPLDDPTVKRIADKHGALQCNQAVLDEVVGILTARPIVRCPAWWSSRGSTSRNSSSRASPFPSPSTSAMPGTRSRSR